MSSQYFISNTSLKTFENLCFQGLYELNINLEWVSPLCANPTKMVNHTQEIPRLLPTNCSSVFDHFVGLALKGLIYYKMKI